MKIRNTSKFDVNEIKKLIKVAKGSISCKNVMFKFKNSRNWAGVMYFDGCSFSGVYQPLCVVRMSKNIEYPVEMNMNGGVDHKKTMLPENKTVDGDNISYKLVHRKTRKPFYVVNNWKELMLSIISHELFHLRLHRTGKKQSETKCEKYALKRLELYRRCD